MCRAPKRINENERETTMKTTTKKNSGIKVTASVKAGGLGNLNHSQRGLRVKAGIKAGGQYQSNHNQSGLRVKAGIKAGGQYQSNHSRHMLAAA
jgi:hypothetical protein